MPKSVENIFATFRRGPFPLAPFAVRWVWDQHSEMEPIFGV